MGFFTRRTFPPVSYTHLDVYKRQSLYQDVPELCKAVKVLKKDKVDPNDHSIEERDWALAPSKYIEFIDHDLDIDYDSEMARIQNEMRLLMTSEELSQSMLKDAFKGIGYEIN